MAINNRLVIMVTAITVAGCSAGSHMLTRDSAPQFIKGEFTHGQTNRLVLESADRRYEAIDFEVRSYQDWAELRKRYYGVEPKHWDRIFSGLDSEHKSYSAQPVLKAADGTELSCRLVWQFGSAPSGICIGSDNKKYSVNFD